MTMGERIRYFRLQNGITQKELGILAGLGEQNANIRIAQYESDSRIPRPDLLDKIAQALDISPSVLSAPDVSSPTLLMHILFALEDQYGLEICDHDGVACLQVNAQNNKYAAQLAEMLHVWKDVAAQLKAGKITQGDYNHWRYHYHASDRQQTSEITSVAHFSYTWYNSDERQVSL